MIERKKRRKLPVTGILKKIGEKRNDENADNKGMKMLILCIKERRKGQSHGGKCGNILHT